MEKIIQSLKSDYEKPFCAYLYDLSGLRNHAGRILNTLPSMCRMFYAVKANSDLHLLKELASFVHGFEVASLGEIEKVREVDQNIPIIFGGPGKTVDEISGAIRHGVTLLHVESIHELRLVNHIARRNGVRQDVLLRANLRNSVPDASLKMAGVPTQFGIDEAEIPTAIALAKSLPSVRLLGFHFHAMSNNCNSKAHADFVNYCLEMAARWQSVWDLEISYLNVGGGIGINYQDTEKQFNWDDFTCRLERILEKYRYFNWQVLFECGRYITSSCGYYAAEVLDIKKNHGHYFCILRGGSHHFRLPAAWKHSHPFTIVPIEKWDYPFERPEVKDVHITVAGELCTPNDILARDVLIPRLRVGDILLFSYAGAYGWSISHHDFLSHPHPEHIYVVCKDLNTKVITTKDE